MAKLKGKYRAGNIMIGRRVYPLAPRKKGEVLNMPAIRANNYEVEVDLVPSPISGAGGRYSEPPMVARLDRKYLKKPTIT